MAPALLSTSRSSTPSIEIQDLNASNLEISRNPFPSKVIPPEQLKFGKYVTDHMLQVHWSLEHGWQRPQIMPYQPISLDPTACVLNYGFECFEGMKAYKDANGQLRLFRPRMNLARFNESAARIALPSFDSEELLKLIAEFVQLEERFIVAKQGYSLYLRPVLIGTSPNLGVTAPTSALLYVVASPVGTYYSQGLKGISLEATSGSKGTRAWYGGVGALKIGGNYAPCIAPERSAQSHGYQQCLWLFGDDDMITEAGTMNLFILLKIPGSERVELVTPPLDGLILPGIIRDCVLSLAREKFDSRRWVVSERKITMPELVTAADAGELLEVFGTGTAAIVSPVDRIRWGEKIINCGPSDKQEVRGLAALVKEWIEARQCGMEEHEWSLLIKDILD